MPRNITEERLALIRRCLEDGWSWHQIHLTHGVSWQTMNRHFPGTQMDLREAGRLGGAIRSAGRKAKRLASR
jgi:hypothetical protein